MPLKKKKPLQPQDWFTDAVKGREAHKKNTDMGGAPTMN